MLAPLLWSVRKKLRELDQAGIGIPMLIVLFLQKSFELMLKQVGQDIPVPLWGTFLLAAVLIFVAWVYDRQLKRKAAKKKVEE